MIFVQFILAAALALLSAAAPAVTSLGAMDSGTSPPVPLIHLGSPPLITPYRRVRPPTQRHLGA